MVLARNEDRGTIFVQFGLFFHSIKANSSMMLMDYFNI